MGCPNCTDPESASRTFASNQTLDGSAMVNTALPPPA